MKFISIFTKAPDHKKFRFTPRYYDQQAEERKEREERIRKELERERGIESSDTGNYRARIAGSFHQSRKRSKKGKQELNAVLLRSGVLLFLTVFAMAYLTWGKDTLYSLLLFVPLYLYLKFRK
jgi:cytochrome c-type biogenesis protein CcmH/NrfG